MKTVLIALFVAATAFSTGHAYAETRTHRSAHVTFDLPSGWSLEGDEATALTTSDPSDEVALMFTLRNHKDMKAANAALDTAIATIATDVKMGQAHRTQINGMEASVVDGTGVAGGKRVQLSVLILKVPGNKFLTIFGVLESAHRHAHEEELKQILGSLTPVRD